MHEIKELNPKELREFGVVTGAIVAGLFGLLLPWLFGATLPLWPWVLAAILALWALAFPARLRPVYRGWMRVGLLIGSVMTPFVLSVVFFLLILPAGLLMRVFRGDPMERNLDNGAPSYRVPSRKPDPTSMERPF
jgi:O-antigen/teichoic acid export membrane protein